MKYNINDLGIVLQNIVNSASLTFDNHSSDNGFFYSSPKEMIKAMNDKNYEPIGISINIPFECSSCKHSYGLAYMYGESLYWVHIPENYWFNLLKQLYGYEEADRILEDILFNKKNRKE